MWRAGTAKQRAIRRTARLPLIGVPVALRFAFLVPLLTSAGGCSVLGYLGGRGIDAKTPDLDTLTVAEVRARPAQTRVAVFLHDGGIHRGRLQGVFEVPPLQAHRELAARLPAGIRLPLPGDTLRLSVGDAAGQAVFARLARPEERYQELGRGSRARATEPVALFASGSRSEPPGLPLANLDRLEWPDGSAIRGSDLSRALDEASWPDLRVLALTDSTGSTDSIPAREIRGIEAPRLKRAAGQGMLIGYVLDCTALFLYLHALSSLAGADL